LQLLCAKYKMVPLWQSTYAARDDRNVCTHSYSCLLNKSCQQSARQSLLLVIWLFTHVVRCMHATRNAYCCACWPDAPFSNWFSSCVAVVVQSCRHAEAILHALLSFVDDMSQALGKTIDISAWRVRYLSCHQFVLQCTPAVVMHTMPFVLERINAFARNMRSCQVTASQLLVTPSCAWNAGVPRKMRCPNRTTAVIAGCLHCSLLSMRHAMLTSTSHRDTSMHIGPKLWLMLPQWRLGSPQKTSASIHVALHLGHWLMQTHSCSFLQSFWHQCFACSLCSECVLLVHYMWHQCLSGVSHLCIIVCILTARLYLRNV